MSRFGTAFFLLLALNVAFWPAVTPRGLTKEYLHAENATAPLYGSMPWWTVKGYLDEGAVPDVALLGSSQMNAAAWSADVSTMHQALDCVLHRRVVSLEHLLNNRSAHNHYITVVNCAVQGAMASDYYMLARTLFRDDRQPKAVVVGVSPRDFIDNKLPAASSTETFRLLAQFVDAGSLGSIAFANPGERFMAHLEWGIEK